MASNRSSQVTSLSGRVQGLKFMQRASASSAPSTPVAVSTSSAAAAAVPAAVSPATTNADEEHWVLAVKPSDTKQATQQKASSTIHEPAWDAWVLASASAAPPLASTSTLPLTVGAGTRRTFGAWARKKRVRKEEEDEEAVEGEEELKDSEEEGESADVKKQKKRKSDPSAPRTFQRPGPPKEDSSNALPAPLRSSSSASKKARKMAAEHETARQAAHQRKLADKVGTSVSVGRKGKSSAAAGRGGLKREEEVDSEDGDEALQGWEDEV